jgi:hypothetical protein
MWPFAAVSRIAIRGRMPILNLMTTGAWQSERIRLRLGIAVLLLLIAQIAAVAHFIGHSTQGDTAGCNICLHAGQSGSALLPSAVPQVAFHATTSELVAIAGTQVFRTYPAVYRSRAPPVSI